MSATSTLPPVWRVVRWPFYISVVVLVVRLVGELLGWDPILFSTESGGQAALLGVSWLMPVFGFVFGWIVTGHGRAPDRPGLSIILHLLGLTLLVGGAFAVVVNVDYPIAMGGLAVLAIVSLFFAWRGWSELLRYNLLYGLSTRIVVVVITAIAFPLNWGTHFEKVAPRPELQELPALDQFFVLIGAQILLWVPATVLIGGIFGSVASMIRGRRPDDARDR